MQIKNVLYYLFSFQKYLVVSLFISQIVSMEVPRLLEDLYDKWMNVNDTREYVNPIGTTRTDNILTQFYEDDEELLMLMMMSECDAHVMNRRYFNISSQRINMDLHHQRLILDGSFKNHYRMTPRAFENLMVMIGPKITVKNAVNSKNRTGIQPLDAKGKLCAVISYLSGERYQDICTIAGIRPSGFYQMLYKVLEAISDSMEMHFPSTPAELDKVRVDFARLSNKNLFCGCVGCVDGMLVRTITPNKTQVANVFTTSGKTEPPYIFVPMHQESTYPSSRIASYK